MKKIKIKTEIKFKKTLIKIGYQQFFPYITKLENLKKLEIILKTPEFIENNITFRMFQDSMIIFPRY